MYRHLSIRRILLLAALSASMALPSTARSFALAGPCIAGSVYDAACDVDHDGDVDIFDIQKTAGHWNQSGVWTSDNDHNHLGQTWTGSNNPLRIEGSFGSPDFAPLVLSSPGGVGLRISSATYGVVVDSADQDGMYVNFTNRYGVGVNSAGNDGMHVNSAGIDGVNVTGSQYAGNFAGNINVTGNCIGCLQANFAINVGDRPLQPGDVVSVLAITSTNFDTGRALWQVAQAQPGQAVVGVVAGRAELVVQEERRPTETGQRLVPREGPAQPGEYVTIVYSGPMQVRAAPGGGAIAAGARLTAALDGTVRPLQTRTIEGMLISEGAPVVGVALQASDKDGQIWVLVSPQ